MRNRTILLLLALISFGSVSAQNSKETKYTSMGDSLVYQLFSQANSNPSKTLDASKKLQVQALRSRDSVLFAKALVVEARAAYNLSNVTTAIAKANAAITIFNLYTANDGLLLAYYELGTIEGSSGDFYQALLKLKKCIALNNGLNDKTWRARILYQIALINHLQHENDLAWDRTLSAQKAIPPSVEPETHSKLLSLQAQILILRNDLSGANEKIEKARALAAQTNDSTAFEKMYAANANLNLVRKNLVDAEVEALKASRISAKMGDPCSYPANQLLLSQVYLALGDINKALNAASIGYSKASSLDDMALLQRDAAQTLSEVFLAKGDSSKAYMFMSRVKYLDDSVLNDEVNKFVLLPGKQTSPNEVASDFDESNYSGKDSDSGLFSDERVNLIIMGALFLICAILTIIIIRRKNETESTSTNSGDQLKVDEKPMPTAVENDITDPEDAADQPDEPTPPAEKVVSDVEAEDRFKALEYQLMEQQRVTEETKTELDARNKYFEEMDKTKNKVFSVLTHDLRQPINQIKSVLNLLEMEQLDGDDRREIVEKLKESVDNSSNALENLLLWSKKQLTGMSTTIVDVHLLPQVWQLESHLKPNLEAKKLKFEIIIPDFFKVKADMNQLDICLRNLITNAIKFSNPEGTITIDALEENGQKIIRVIDQGVGMTPEQLEKLRGQKENFTTLGTMNEKGTGLGIMITKEFMENQEGKLDIMSRKGEGSIFSLIFPAGSASRTPYQG